MESLRVLWEKEKEEIIRENKNKNKWKEETGEREHFLTPHRFPGCNIESRPRPYFLRNVIRLTMQLRVKIELFSREGQIFPGGSNFDIFPEIVKSRNLLCVKLLFSCILSKTDPSLILALVQRGSTTAPGESNPKPPTIFTLMQLQSDMESCFIGFRAEGINGRSRLQFINCNCNVVFDKRADSSY